MIESYNPSSIPETTRDKNGQLIGLRVSMETTNTKKSETLLLLFERMRSDRGASERGVGLFVCVEVLNNPSRFFKHRIPSRGEKSSSADSEIYG